MDRQRQLFLAAFAVVMFVIAVVYYPKTHWAVPASNTFVGIFALCCIPFCKKRD